MVAEAPWAEHLPAGCTSFVHEVLETSISVQRRVQHDEQLAGPGGRRALLDQGKSTRPAAGMSMSLTWTEPLACHLLDLLHDIRDCDCRRGFKSDP